MGSGFAKKKKQAKLMQDQLMKMQEKMAAMEVIGEAGNGLVTIKINGDHEVLRITIQPDCVDPEDVEGLEDLIKLAYNNALKKLQDQTSQGMPPGLGSFGF